MVEYAKRLAELGWHVFPVWPIRNGICACHKGGECGRYTGKHPLYIHGVLEHGLRDATRSEWQIGQWWKMWPDANIGVRMGEPSGVFAFDVDPDKGGPDSLAALEARYGRLPSTVENITGSTGSHHIFKWPGFEVETLAEAFGDEFPGLDIRGDGGYIVAPPSLHLSGRRYAWEASSDPFEGVTPVDAPEWLFAALAAAKKAREAKRGSGSNPLVLAERITEGSRNQSLFKLGSSLRGRGLGESAIFAALVEHNRVACVPPLEESEVRSIARSAAKLEANSIPRDEIRPNIEPWTDDDLPAPIDDAPADGPRSRLLSSRVSVSDIVNPKKYHRTDWGNAERLVDQYGSQMRYVAAWSKYVTWSGKHWKPDELGGAPIAQLAMKMIRDMQQEAWDTVDPDARKEYVKFALACENREKLSNIVSLAGKQPGIPITPEDLDQKRELLNVSNGTLELGPQPRLREHRREDLLTRIIDIPYDPSATCPLWDQFMEDIFLGDVETMRFVWKACGYSLTGLLDEQCFFFLHGGGKNGKTTFIEVLRHVMGDYSRSTAMETFMVKFGGPGNTEDLARLKEARFVATSETEQNKRFSESLMKRLTGGDPITARFLYQNSFEFVPEFKIWMYGNHRPETRGTDDGFWRRVRLIPFDYTVPAEKLDDKLQSKLLTEAPGILNWMVRGCGAWYRERLGTAASITKAVESYRESNDILGRFLDDATIRVEEGEIQCRKLYEVYCKWCRDSNEHEMKMTKFGLAMAERGEPSQERRQHNVYVGRTLKADQEDLYADVYRGSRD